MVKESSPDKNIESKIMKMIRAKRIESCNPLVCPYFYFNMHLAYCSKTVDEKKKSHKVIYHEKGNFPDWCPLEDWTDTQ